MKKNDTLKGRLSSFLDGSLSRLGPHVLPNKSTPDNFDSISIGRDFETAESEIRDVFIATIKTLPKKHQEDLLRIALKRLYETRTICQLAHFRILSTNPDSHGNT